MNSPAAYIKERGAGRATAIVYNKGPSIYYVHRGERGPSERAFYVWWSGELGVQTDAYAYCIALIFGGAKILANSQFRQLAEF